MAAVLRGAGAGGVSRQSGRAAGGAADGGKCGVAPVYSLVRAVYRPGADAPGFIETLPSRGSWTRLGMAPVSVISGVDVLDADGATTRLLPRLLRSTSTPMAKAGFVSPRPWTPPGCRGATRRGWPRPG